MSKLRVVGLIGSIILLFFGLADVPEQARRWQSGIRKAWTVMSPFIDGNTARWVLVVGGVMLLLWTWLPSKERVRLRSAIGGFVFRKRREDTSAANIDATTTENAPSATNREQAHPGEDRVRLIIEDMVHHAMHPTSCHLSGVFRRITENIRSAQPTKLGKLLADTVQEGADGPYQISSHVYSRHEERSLQELVGAMSSFMSTYVTQLKKLELCIESMREIEKWPEYVQWKQSDQKLRIAIASYRHVLIPEGLKTPYELTQ